MGFRGGDLRQLMIGNREVTPVAEGDFSFALGGMEAEVKLAGNGTSYATGKRSAAYFKGPILCDSGTKLLEFLQGLEDAGNAVPVVLTKMNGDTYMGSLYVVGQLEEKRDGSIDLDLQGGRMEKI